MNDFNKAPIFVTGIERSGGSIIASILEAGGAFVGTTSRMKENFLLGKLMDEFYAANDLDPAGQFPLPGKRLYIPSDWNETVLKQLKSNGYNGQKPWMYKSFRLGQTWRLWNYAFPNARWIIVRRRTGDIIHSCKKTGYMRAFKNAENRAKVGVMFEEDGWKWWIRRQEQNFIDMIRAGVNCKVVWPERIKFGDYQQTWETLKWVDLNWNDQIIKKSEAMLRNYKEIWQE